MKDTLLAFPSQFLEGYELTRNLESYKNHNIVWCGMGGSSLVCDIVKDAFYMDEKPTKFVSVRDYFLPHWVGSEEVIIIASYSGNTEEAISCFFDALGKKAPMIVITHGGKLLELAQEKGITTIHLPECPQPRLALGYFFGVLLGIMEKCHHLEYAEKRLQNLTDLLTTHQDSMIEFSLFLTEGIKNRIPMIYAPEGYGSCAHVSKVNINENSKTPCISGTLPEMNHNEMISLISPLWQPVMILIKGKHAFERTLHRGDTMGALLQEYDIPILVMELIGEERYEEILSGICVSLWLSYHLALEYGIDPVPVDLIEEFKMRLNS